MTRRQKESKYEALKESAMRSMMMDHIGHAIYRDLLKSVQDWTHIRGDRELVAIDHAFKIGSTLMGIAARKFEEKRDRIYPRMKDRTEPPTIETAPTADSANRGNQYLRNLNYPEGQEDLARVHPDGRGATLPDGLRLRVSGDLSTVVHVGDFVRTSYATGPYRVIEVHEYVVYGLRCYSITGVDTWAEPNKDGKYRSNLLSYLNELVLVDGRILHLFESNNDEVFLVDPKDLPREDEPGAIIGSRNDVLRSAMIAATTDESTDDDPDEPPEEPEPEGDFRQQQESLIRDPPTEKGDRRTSIDKWLDKWGDER